MYLFKRGCVSYLALDDGSRISTYTRTKNDALRVLNNFTKEIEDPPAPGWSSVSVYGMMPPDDEERDDDYGLWNIKPEGER